METPSQADNLEFIPEETAPPPAEQAQAAEPSPPVPPPPAVAKARSEAVPEAAAEAPAADQGPSRLALFLQKLKHPAGLLHASYLKAIDSSYDALQRYRKRFEVSGEEEPDKHESRNVERRPGKKPVQKSEPAISQQAEQPAGPAPEPKTSYLIGLLAAVAGLLLGVVFSYALLATVFTHQAKMIADQFDEIARLEQQLSKLQTAEAGYRNEIQAYRKALEKIEKRI